MHLVLAFRTLQRVASRQQAIDLPLTLNIIVFRTLQRVTSRQQVITLHMRFSTATFRNLWRVPPSETVAIAVNYRVKSSLSVPSGGSRPLKPLSRSPPHSCSATFRTLWRVPASET